MFDAFRFRIKIMTNQEWDCVFVKVGHYVACKSTKYGETIVLCSDYEMLPPHNDMEADRGEAKDSMKNQIHNPTNRLSINFSMVSVLCKPRWGRVEFSGFSWCGVGGFSM